MIPLSRISEIASAHGKNPAILLADRSITWSEFQSEVGRYINALGAIAKAQPIDSVCFISPNRHEIIYLTAAAASLKLTVFGLDYTQDQDTLRTLLRTAKADVVVVSSKALLELGLEPETLTAGRPAIDFDGRLNGTLQLSEFDAEDSDQIIALPRPFRAIGFTSGTTGCPKVVLREKSFDARRFSYFTTRYGFSSADRHMITIPLYHAAGMGWARLFLSLGGTVVLPPPGDSATAARMLVSEGVTTAAMTPPIAISICRELDQSHRSLIPGLLRFVLVGGKNFSSADKEYCSKIMVGAIHEYYGTTETGVNTIAEPDDIISHPDTVGKPFDGNEILVVDPAGNPVSAGQPGTIAIHSYMNMTDYIGSDANVITHGGKRYIVTNETGSLGADGYLRLANRNADVGASNMYLLEDKIKRLPCVSDAAIAFGEENKRNMACGYVIHENAVGTPEAISQRVRKILKEGRIRARIAPVETIPYSPSGKVRLPEFRALVRRHAERASYWNLAPLVGALLLGGTAAAWGGMFHVAKSALTTLDAVHVTLVRYGLAALVFLALLILREGFSAFRIGRDIIKLWFLGSLGFAGFSILAFWGLAYTRPEHGAIIMALMPLLTAIVMMAWKGAKISLVTGLCILAALFGVLLAVSGGKIELLQGGSLIPNLVILAGALCWVIYTIGARNFPDYSVLRYTAISCGLGAVTIVCVTVIATLFGMIQTPALPDLTAVRFELAYLVLIAGVAAVFSWNTGIKLLGPVNGVLFINLVPISALFFGWLKGHSFSTAELLGGSLTILALVLNNLNDRGWLRRLKPSRLFGRSPIATT